MNTLERFEYMADLFYKDEGILAPGKDRALPDGFSDDERRELWQAWVEVFYQDLFKLHEQQEKDKNDSY